MPRSMRRPSAPDQRCNRRAACGFAGRSPVSVPPIADPNRSAPRAYCTLTTLTTGVIRYAAGPV